MAEPKLEIEKRIDRLESAILFLAGGLGQEEPIEDILRNESHSTKVEDGSTG